MPKEHTWSQKHQFYLQKTGETPGNTSTVKKNSGQKVLCLSLSYTNSLKQSIPLQLLQAELQCKGACLWI